MSIVLLMLLCIICLTCERNRTVTDATMFGTSFSVHCKLLLFFEITVTTVKEHPPPPSTPTPYLPLPALSPHTPAPDMSA